MRRGFGVVQLEDDIARRVDRRRGAGRLGAQSRRGAERKGAADIEDP